MVLQEEVRGAEKYVRVVQIMDEDSEMEARCAVGVTNEVM